VSNDVIIARPYARAAFEYAKNHDLKSWLIAIALLSEVANQTKIRALLRDPTVTPQQRLTVIKEICAGMLDQAQENFLATLASNKRLFCLSEIINLFHQYYDEYKKLKEILAKDIIKFITPFRENRMALEKDMDSVRNILKRGGEMAKKRAMEKMARVKEVIGVN